MKDMDFAEMARLVERQQEGLWCVPQESGMLGHTVRSGN
jgi:hypothetical protein